MVSPSCDTTVVVTRNSCISPCFVYRCDVNFCYWTWDWRYCARLSDEKLENFGHGHFSLQQSPSFQVRM